MQQPQTSVNEKHSNFNQRKRPRKTNPLFASNYTIAGEVNAPAILTSLVSEVSAISVQNSNSHSHSPEIDNEVQVLETSSSLPPVLSQNSLSVIPQTQQTFQFIFKPCPELDGFLDKTLVFEPDAEGNFVLQSPQMPPKKGEIKKPLIVRCKNCGLMNDTGEKLCFRCNKYVIKSTYSLRGMQEKNKEVISISSEDEDDKPSPNKISKFDEIAANASMVNSSPKVEESTTLASYKIPKKSAKLGSQNFVKKEKKKAVPKVVMNTDTKTNRKNANNHDKLPLEHSEAMTILEHLVEPDYEDEDYIGPVENQLKQSISDSSYAVIGCRSIRIGSHKVLKSKPIQVIITDLAILFDADHVQTKNRVKCVVPIKSVARFYIYPGHRMPLIVLLVGIKCAFHLRRNLGISTSPDDPIYFSPSYSKEKDNVAKRYIMFIPELLADMSVTIYHRIFADAGCPHTMQEISYKVANDLLLKAALDTKEPPEATSPRKIVIPAVVKKLEVMKKPAKVSSPKVQPLYPRIPDAALTDGGKLLSYSSPDKKKTIELCSQDLITLAPESFINDQIIEYWLLYVQYQLMSQEQRDKSFFFPTFFYSTLTTTPNKRGKQTENFKGPAAEIRHNRVKGWTKGVDLFEKDFIIIPVNESFHWYLAIICYPGLEGPVNSETGEPISPELVDKKSEKLEKCLTQKKSPDNIVDGEDSNKPEVIDCPPDIDPQRDEEPEDPDEDEESEFFAMSESEESGAEEKIPNLDLAENKIRVKRPCILIFDSMSGERRSKIYNTLREYLRFEIKKKKGIDRRFTRSNMPGCAPKVPQQPNHYDCGIYVLQYAESFMQQPILDYSLPLVNLKKWFSRTIVRTKRKEIYTYVVDRVMIENPSAEKYLPVNVVFPEVEPLVVSKVKTGSVAKKEVEVNENEVMMDTLVPSQEEPEPYEEVIDSSTCSVTTRSRGVKSNGPSSPSLLSNSNLNRVEGEGEPMEVN